MKTVYKYPINPSLEKIALSIPGGGPVISAGVDPSGDLCVWALADTDKEDEKVIVFCVGTGWPLDLLDAHKIRFVDTVKTGFYMWHIFVEVK